MQVEQIWGAITSNTIDAYPCGGEDHARESLFNMELVHAKEFDVHGIEVSLRNKIIFVFEFHLHVVARWSSYGVNFGEMENQV